MEMQNRFQQKQMHEKEEKLLRLYESQQQRVFERVGRGSAGSNPALNSTSVGGGKVRQMFDERRQKAGIDRSYPLEPLSKSNSGSKSVKSTSTKSVTKVVRKSNIISNNNNNNYDGVDDENNFRLKNGGAGFETNLREINHVFSHRLNMNDDLDNEEMPQIGFDELDDRTYVTGKLANVGGKLPSQYLNGKKSVNDSDSSAQRAPVQKSQGVKKAAPSIQQQQQKKFVPPKTAASSTSSSRSNSSTTTPVRNTTKMTTVAAAKKSKSPSPQNSVTQRAPSTQRPSSKQSVKTTVVRDDLEECHHCGRRFAADRLAVHETICSKTGKKKRKTYDATKHRVQGTELEAFVPKGNNKTASKTSKQVKPAGKKDWRRTHEEFIAAIRAAKTAQAHIAKGGKLSDLPPPPPSSNPDYVQCPHCGRRFNEAAAERHIPKCATFLHNKPKPAPPSRSKVTNRK